MSIDLSSFKDGQRRVWSAGDYPDMATHIEEVAVAVVDRAAPSSGERLLDVATGTGNVALPAATSGALVTGLDLTPRLLAVAAERARGAGLDVTWVEGDAEELPFDDDSFDVATSCLGVMYAPRHERAAAELTRVTRSGGRIVVAAWTPGGLVGEMLTATAAYVPPPPPGLGTPETWGQEEHVRSLFAGGGAELEFERRTVTFRADSAEAWMEYNERVLGPAIAAKQALEPQGRWDDLRRDWLGLFERANEAGDGSFAAPSEYLISAAWLP
jgi:ubiquinone/menaquinone biosynthesis C-methylase UbiE